MPDRGMMLSPGWDDPHRTPNRDCGHLSGTADTLFVVQGPHSLSEVPAGCSDPPQTHGRGDSRTGVVMLAGPPALTKHVRLPGAPPGDAGDAGPVNYR